MSKYLVLLLLILATALAIARDNVAQWTEVSSAHFTVFTDSGEKDARRIALEFERMRDVFQRVYPQLQGDPESPITILGIKEKTTFHTLEPDAYLKKGAVKLHGLFMSASEKNYILMRLGAEGGNPFSVALHEYTHVLLHRAHDSIPLWLNEGLAEFYANSEIHDKEVLLGRPNQRHLLLLRDQRWLPFASLFTIDENSPYYIEQEKGSIFYAESWALMHYLMMRDHEERTSKVTEYTRLLTARLNPLVAATRAFGDLKKLKRDVQAYVLRRDFHQFRMTGIAQVDDSELEIELITPLQAQAVQADFLACSRRLVEARALVERVLQEAPDNTSARETEAFLDLADEAVTENNLRAAVQTEPSSAAAYDRLASFLTSRGKDLEQAKEFESTAVSLDPGNLKYRLTLANVLLSMGSMQSAAGLLRDAAKLAKTPQETKEVEQLLAETEAYASTRVPDKREIQQRESAAVPDNGRVTRSFIPRGPHLFLVGTLKDVRCSPPALDVTVTSRAKTVTLHSENYYKIQFTALFSPTGDLKPCDDLESRTAKVEYVEPADVSDTPRLIAIELHK